MRRLAWAGRRVGSLLRPRELRRAVRIWREVDLSSVRVVPSRFQRAGNAAMSVIRKPPSDGPIWAVSMVKNESDIIAETVDNLRAQGIDHILVADNGSTDGTPSILRRAGVHVVSDPIVDYWQADKVTHLMRSAVRNGASWIVPFDADELWKGSGGRTIAETLRSSQADVVVADWMNYMPLDEDLSASTFAERFPWRERERDDLDKVAFRANWLARLTMGNHTVVVPGNLRERRLRIAHYPFRSPAQMLRKANEGARAARLAGTIDRLPRWYKLEGMTEADALQSLQALAGREGLVHDPSSGWDSPSRVSATDE